MAKLDPKERELLDSVERGEWRPFERTGGSTSAFRPRTWRRSVVLRSKPVSELRRRGALRLSQGAGERLGGVEGHIGVPHSEVR